MDKFANLILWIFVIIWVTIWSAWLFLGQDVFEIGQAFSIFGFASAFLIVKKEWLISRIAFTIACNQLADELFFNPYIVSWNEYLTISVLIVLIFLRFYKVNFSVKSIKKINK